MKPRILFWGIVFDRWTPAVEGRLTQDLIRLQNLARHKYSDVVVVCDSEEPARVCESLGLAIDTDPGLASVWTQYKTGPKWPEIPVPASTVMQRDLYTPVKKQSMDPSGRDTGYFLPEQGRPNQNYLTLTRPAPNGYAPVDPVLVSLWT